MFTDWCIAANARLHRFLGVTLPPWWVLYRRGNWRRRDKQHGNRPPNIRN
jgi:hypothetical protein